MKKRFLFFSLSVLISIAMVIFLIDSKTYSAFVLEGFQIWATNVLPCLFPFFVFAKLLTELDNLNAASKTFLPLTRLYKLPPPSGYVFLIALISGYPIGVKTSCELNRQGVLTQAQCEKTASLCNFAGPIFAIGTVGAFFDDYAIGGIIFVSAVLGAIINEIFYTNKTDLSATPDNFSALPVKNKKNIFYDSISSSIESILFVGGCIAVFFLLGKMITSVLPKNTPPVFSTIIVGLLEMTSGAKSAALLPNRFLGILLACAFVGFGGLCVFVQCCAYWSDSNINILKMLLKKATQTVASCAVCAALCLLFGYAA